MTEIEAKEKAMEQLIQTIADGFEKLHIDNDQNEKIMQLQYENQIKIQDRKNRKWRYGAIIGGILVFILGGSLHQTIKVFEDDMDTMSEKIVEMSGYMKTMSVDMSEMNQSISVMSPQMTSMATDMHAMSGDMHGMSGDMNAMRNDMGQMNNAMSPLMGNMQKFVPGNW